MKIIPNSTLTWNGELQKRTSATFIILHHAASEHCTIMDIEKWHKARGFLGFAYNYFVDKMGNIYEGRPLWAADADATEHNFDSPSVCFEGDYEVEANMPEAQILAGIEIVRYLRKCFPQAIVSKHSDVNFTSCPGKNFSGRIIGEGLIDAESPSAKHWAQDAYDYLRARGMIINETRFDDKITRGEIFVLLSQIVLTNKK